MIGLLRRRGAEVPKGIGQRARWTLKHHPLWPLMPPFLAMLTVSLLGTLGFYLVTGGAHGLVDYFYMTAITLTTVGYNDPLNVASTTVGRVYTMVILIVGMGVTLYSVSAVTAFIVEGHLRRLFWERRMIKKIHDISGHFIVCGTGETGSHVIHELLVTQTPFVAIDADREKMERLAERYRHDFLMVVGDATEEDTLEAANIDGARGLVSALSNDKENLFLVVTAHFMNPELRIVAKCIDHDSVQKFKKAGAANVVSPTYIGGMRLASECIRPHVVDFLDSMLHGPDKTMRVSEVTVCPGGRAVDMTLAQSRLSAETGMLVIAIKDCDTAEYTYNPSGSHVLKSGTVVLAIGNAEQKRRLEALICTTET